MTFQKGNQYGKSNRGKICSNETKKKISDTKKGMHISPKTEFKKGHKVLYEWIEKARKTNIGRKHTEEVKKRIGQASKEHWQNPEYREKTRRGISQTRKGIVFSDEQIKNMRLSHLGHKPNPLTKEQKQRIGQKNKVHMLRLWKDDNYAKNQIKAQSRKPTSPEKYLMVFLNTNFPNEWKYVGNKEFVIEGKNPDFVNCNGKKLIIEFNGNYWHQDKEKDIERSEHFVKYGFKTLFLYYEDLKDEQLLKQKIKDFV